MSTLVLVGEASKKGRPYLKTVLDSAWTVVDFDAAAPERLTAVAAIGMPAGLRWKEQLPALKFLQLSSAGLDGLDFALLPSGCRVSNVYEHEASIAEYVFTALFELENQGWISRAQNGFKKGEWLHLDRIGHPPRPTVCGKRIGIIGYGHIGRRCAEIATALNMKVTVHTRTKPADKVELAATVEDLAKISDYLLVACPETPETRALVGENALSLLPANAIVINIARGPVIEEQALFEALSTKRIGGAILDVWYQYPSSAAELRHGSRFAFHELDNVFLTPHLSAHTPEMVERRWTFMAANLNRFLKNQPLLNPVADAGVKA